MDPQDYVFLRVWSAGAALVALLILRRLRNSAAVQASTALRIAGRNWNKIVGYYLAHSPGKLPDQSFPAQPQLDPDFFKTGPLVPRLQSSGIITLLKTDSVHELIFVGEAGSNTLRVFDWSRHLLTSLVLGSPPTDLIVGKKGILVLESGITL